MIHKEWCGFGQGCVRFGREEDASDVVDACIPVKGTMSSRSKTGLEFKDAVPLPKHAPLLVNH